MNRSDSTHPVEALSAYLDGELSPSEAAELGLHLKECPECSVALEDLRLLSRTVAEEEPPPLPADLAGRIAGRLEPARPGKSAHRHGWFTGFFGAPLAAAAAALLAAGVLWTVWQTRQTTVWSTPPEVAEQEMPEKGESGEKSLAFDDDKNAAMAEADPETAILAEDDTAGGRALGARQEPFSAATGPAAAGAQAGRGLEKGRSAKKGPAPSTLDRDVRADLAAPGESLEGEREEAAGYAPSPPMEPGTIPPPTVAKAAPAESVKDEEARRLHELGQVSSAEAEPEAALPERIQEEQKVEVRDGLAYVTPGEGAVPPAEAGAAQVSPEMKEKRARRASPLAANAVAPDEAERVLVLREPDYEIRLTPSGEMTVSAGEYACTVSPDEIAPSKYYESVLAGTAGGGSDTERQLLLGLARGPYREALERKCGPLPEPVAGDPERDP
jgi:negative regulator of sigma E activity